MVSSELRARSIVLCPSILSDMLLTKYTHLYDGVHEGEPDPSCSVCKHQAAAIGIAGRSSIDPNLLAASIGIPVSGPGISGSSIGEYVIKHDHTPKPGCRLISFEISDTTLSVRTSILSSSVSMSISWSDMTG